MKYSTAWLRMSKPQVASVLALGKYTLEDGSYSKELKVWVGKIGKRGMISPAWKFSGFLWLYRKPLAEPGMEVKCLDHNLMF